MLWTWSLAGTLDFRPGGILADTASPGVLGVLFALYVFGIGKAALMPFHRWLPAAMVAPTPVSALLHAVNAALQPHAGGVIRSWSAPLDYEHRDDQGIGTRNPDT